MMASLNLVSLMRNNCTTVPMNGLADQSLVPDREGVPADDLPHQIHTELLELLRL